MLESKWRMGEREREKDFLERDGDVCKQQQREMIFFGQERER